MTDKEQKELKRLNQLWMWNKATRKQMLRSLELKAKSEKKD